MVASAHERGRTPAVNKRVRDEEELTCGRLTVRAHSVPGHTKGSMVFEVFSRAAAAGTPSAAFTGDALFCGGCGALFECSATTMHASLATLTQRLAPETLLFPGHEYSEMLLKMAVQREPHNELARAKLDETLRKRARKQPSLPSTLREEMAYNVYLKVSPKQLGNMFGCEPCVE